MEMNEKEWREEQEWTDVEGSCAKDDECPCEEGRLITVVGVGLSFDEVWA